jgi:site-specific DNA recombinase
MSRNKPKIENSSFGKNTKTELSLEGYFGLPYLRVSSKRQEIEGTGLQSQEKRCLIGLDNLGVVLEKSFFDSFTGGGDFMNRPAMRDLLAHIDNNPHKKYVVIFDDLKRFARDTEFHLKLRIAFKNRGVVLKCLNYNFEDTPEGMFVETVLAASNELERKQNARQVIQKQKARLESGYRAFTAPLGYSKQKDPKHGKLDVPNIDAEYIKEALEGFASMRFVHKIDAVKFLQGKEVISLKQGADKGTATFDKMLKEVFYAGYIEYKPWEVLRREGHHQAIISLETF